MATFAPTCRVHSVGGASGGGAPSYSARAAYDDAQAGRPFGASRRDGDTARHPDSAAPLPRAADLGDDFDTCVICLDNAISHAFIPCGHHCTCGDCSAKIMMTEGKRCPLCRVEAVGGAHFIWGSAALRRAPEEVKLKW